ncbi:MAG TPA: ABC transporter permease [Holophaga sp.]|nr:ABC transporter permease [Holophaga sp.]
MQPLKLPSILRDAFRQIRSAPGYALVIVLTLALGIGANVAIFSVVSATFLKGLPYPHADRLVKLVECKSQGDGLSVSYPNFLDWRREQRSFSGLAFWHDETRALRLSDSTEQVSVGMVSSDFFGVLGVKMAEGRGMTAQDDQMGAAPAVWVTSDLCQKRLGGAGAVGRTIRLGEQSFTIAGVIAPGFRFIQKVDVIIPVAPQAVSSFIDNRDNHNNAFAIARLKPGVDRAAAASDMNLIAGQLGQLYPGSNKGIGVEVTPLREAIASGSGSRMALLFSAVGMVLLIACVNVANMQIARSFAREKEMAIRAAVGANRWQLVRQLLAESLALSGLGTIVGTCIGLGGYQFLRALIPWQIQNLIPEQVGVDGWMLAFVALMALATGIGFGFAPAWRLSHADPNGALKSNSSVKRGWLGRWRLGDALVAIQVALALMLVIGAGLVIRSFDKLLRVDPGFRPAQVLSLRLPDPPASLYQHDPLGMATYMDQSLDAARRVSGVESCAIASCLPFSHWISSMMFYIEGRDASDVRRATANTHIVSPEYFHVMGIPLLAGRNLTGREAQPTVPAGFEFSMEGVTRIYQGFELDGLVSQRMAEHFWPGENPIGKRFHLGRPGLEFGVVTVVGVVGNTAQDGLDRGIPDEYYLSSHQFPQPGGIFLVARASGGDAGALAKPLREALSVPTQGNPVQDVKTMTERMSEFNEDRSFNTGLMAFFAATALSLALVGIYGVLSSNIGRSIREMGIRLALGATRTRVLGDLLLRSLLLVAAGSVLGLIGAWQCGRIIQSQLFGVSATDPLTYWVSTLLVLLTAFPGCLFPALRAARVNPNVVLREE